MARETLPRERVALPELDAEDEVDLGRYWSRLVAAWWIVALGLLLGIIGGYLYGKRSPTLWEATVTLYLGQPVLPGGGGYVQSLATNPRIVGEIVHSEFVLKNAARASGLHVGQLRGHVSSKTLTPAKGTVKAGGTQLEQVTVTGNGPKKVEAAANAIGDAVVTRLSRFADIKIRGFKERLKVNKAALDSIRTRIATLQRAMAQAGNLRALDSLVLVSQLDNAEQQHEALITEKTTIEQNLAVAEEIEKPQLVFPAAAKETTARSVRNSTLVGAALGLILGAIAALLWEPLRRRWRREPL